MNREAEDKNPVQDPDGWAVDKNPGLSDQDPKAIEEQKKKDQAAQADRLNREPDTTTNNPAQDAEGWAVKGDGDKKEAKVQVIARVYASDPDKLEGARVLLRDKVANSHFSGIVEADGENEFGVRWSDDKLTLESKSDFELWEV